MKRYILFIALALISAISLSAKTTAKDGNTYKTVTDIQYTTKTDLYAAERCKLDVYYPTNITDAPIVVWFHGGGLTSGNKKIPTQLKNKGLVVISVNYRLLPNVDIEACLDDCAEAVAWAFRNAQEYNGSRHKLFVAGHSAGGYITSMLGLDKSWLQRYGIDANAIAGLFPFSGQAISHFAYRKMNNIPGLQPIIDRYAPLYHVRADAPPMVLITGDRELEMLGRYEENAYFWRMMKLTGHKETYLYELGGYDHGSMAAPAHHILLNHLNRILGNTTN